MFSLKYSVHTLKTLTVWRFADFGGLPYAHSKISKCILFSCSSLPVNIFSEVVQSDATDASQSVPMVSTSTPSLVVAGAAGSGEERDDVFLEPDTDR